MDDAERAPLPPGALLQDGRYRIVKLLGTGGFALTYLAQQGRWNLSVCIKEFFPTGCERRRDGIYACDDHAERRVTEGLQAFSDEAAALARFNHPGIVRVLGNFSENHTAYLVEEVLEGMTLSDGLALAGKMKQPAVLKFAQQFGLALLMVHAAGLVHSDLKPENIFLTREGRYVLLDFGLTRGFLSAASASKGTRGLSPGYAPPEQYLQGQKLTPATDVYGFAATLYALFTGGPPPEANLRSQGQVLPAIQPSNASITPSVEKALFGALMLDARRRTPGVREFMHQMGLDCTPRAVSYKPTAFELRATHRAHPTGITVLSLHSPTHRLYSGGRDGLIKVWSWPDLEPLGSVQAHEGVVSALAVSSEGSCLVSGSETGELRLWRADLAPPGHLLTQEGSITNRVQFHGDLMAACFANGRCCLIGPSLTEPVRWVAHAGPANSVDFHPSGTFLATGGDDNTVRFWEIPEPQLISELKGHVKSVQSAHFSPDGTTLLSASSDHCVKFWDLTTNEVVRDLKSHQALVFEARYTCRDHLIVSLSGDHFLRGFHLDSGRVAYSSEARNDRTRALTVDPSRPLIATGGSDGEITVWAIPEQTC
jgi:WD40 repeat protein